MSSFTKTLAWMLVLVLAAGAGGGLYVYRLWERGDEVLRQALLAKFHEALPGWDIDMGRTRFDFQGRIHIDDFTLKVTGQETPLAQASETIIVVDQGSLSSGTPIVQQIRVSGAKVLLVRDSAGHWNVERLPPKPPMGTALWEWIVTQAEVTVRFESDSADPTVVRLRDGNCKLLPTGRRQFLISGDATNDLLESVKASGQWNLDAASWSVHTTLSKVQIGSDLAALAAGISPEAQSGIDKVDVLIANSLNERTAIPANSAGPQTMSVIDGINALADIHCDVAVAGAGQPATATGMVTFLKGELAHPALPFSLYELGGTLRWSADEIDIQQLSAHNGETLIQVSGKAFRAGERARIVIDMKHVPFDTRTRQCLTGGLARTYDLMHPQGFGDINVTLTHQSGTWDKSCIATFQGCAVKHDAFPILVERVSGKVEFARHKLTADAKGFVGTTALSLTGHMDDVGPEARAQFDIIGREVEIDDRFRLACPERLQKVIEALQLRGRIDGAVRISRAHGLGQPYVVAMGGRIHDASLMPKAFPYLVTHASAKIRGSGSNWVVTEFQGEHEGAEVAGKASVSPNELGICVLQADITTKNATLDRQLYSALRESWQALWREFNPHGLVDAGVHVSWPDGGEASIEVDAKVHDASMQLRSFPLRLDQVTTEVTLRPDGPVIKSFTGKYHETPIRLSGFGDLTRPGEWRVRLEQLTIDDLDPDVQFRKALPDSLRQVIETLDPRGRMSIDGMIELAGTVGGADPITAAWDMNFIHSGTTVTAGIDLDNLYGAVRMQGTWDGEEVHAAGRIDLKSLTVRGLALSEIKGPISVHGKQLVIGSKEKVSGDLKLTGRNVDTAERMTAKFIDGILALDGVAQLEGQTSYHVRMTLEGGRLERYAQLYLPGQRKLAGQMNGWVDLYGRGASEKNVEGRGRLLISPAAIYELPVVLATLKVLSLGGPDKIAFRTAGVDFEVGGSQVLFRKINLVGDAISLLGRGYVRFDGNVALDFYSREGRSTIPIPLVREALSSLTRGWVEVKVRGTTSNPDARIRTLPQMDDTLRMFLGVLDGRPNMPARAAQKLPDAAR